MKIIIGLGNPGSTYQDTRHNIGFVIVEKLAAELNLEPFKAQTKFHADTTSGTYQGEKILLAKPTTFMNNSGQAVAALRNFYNLDLNDLWLVYDDLDLPLGQVRIRTKGSSGTHNGMKSVIEHLGNLNQFPRFRFGIESRGATAPKQQDTNSFVLSPFTADEQSTVSAALNIAVKALKDALTNGLEDTIGSYNMPL